MNRFVCLHVLVFAFTGRSERERKEEGRKEKGREDEEIYPVIIWEGQNLCN